jgi:hypothetical protein
VGDVENIAACQREAGELRRKLTVRPPASSLS